MLTCLMLAKNKPRLDELVKAFHASKLFSSVTSQYMFDDATFTATPSPDVVCILLSGKEKQPPNFSRYKMQFPFSNIVLISPHKAHAYEVLTHNFFGFLLYPLLEHEIAHFLIKIKKRLGAEKHSLCISSHRDYKYVALKDILFLKADNNTTEFYMANGHTVHGFKTLKNYQQKMPAQFLRIHKSYMVNTSKIRRIHFGKKTCELRGHNHPIPFSKSFLTAVNRLNSQLKNRAY